MLKTVDLSYIIYTISLLGIGSVIMELIMHINNVKSIKDLTFSFPLEKGLYAILHTSL